MSRLHEYALLCAVAIPVLAIVVLNAILWLSGERGTLLLPSSGSFPSLIETNDAVESLVDCAPASTEGRSTYGTRLPANDELAREAA